MAITARTDVNTASQTGVAQTTALTLTAISDGAADDLIVVVGGWSDNNGVWDAITGFTENVDHQTSTGDDRSLGVQYKKHTGSEGANYSLTGTDTNTANAMSGLVCAFDGVDTTTPIDVTTVIGTASNNVSPTNPAITTATDGALVLLIIINTSGGMSAWTAPTGYTLLGEVLVDSGSANGANIAIAYKEIATAGTETPGAWSGTGISSTAESTMATVAIRPSTGGGGGFEPQWAKNTNIIMQVGL